MTNTAIVTPQGHTLGCLPGGPDIRDYKYSPAILDPRALPTHVDLRTTGFARPVQNQGALGACALFSGGSTFQFVQRKQGLVQYDPSELFLYYQARLAQGTVDVDSGTSIRQSMKTMADFGVPPDADWPYNPSQFAVKPPQKAYDNGLQHQLMQYLSVAQNIDAIRTCLAEGFPISFGFPVYESFERPPCSTTGYVPFPAAGEKLLGYHAMHILGYEDGSRILITQNSWGTGFGAAGFMYFPYDFLISPALGFDFWTPRMVEGVAPTPPPPPVPPTPPATPDFVDKLTISMHYSKGRTLTRTESFPS